MSDTFLSNYRREAQAAKQVEAKLKELEDFRTYLRIDPSEIATGISVNLQKVYMWGEILSDVEYFVECLENELEAYEAQLYLQTRKSLQSARVAKVDVKETEIRNVLKSDETIFRLKMTITKWRKWAKKIDRCGVVPAKGLSFTYNQLVKMLKGD